MFLDSQIAALFDSKDLRKESINEQLNKEEADTAILVASGQA